MADNFSITIQGIDALAAKFDRVQQNKILLPPMERAVVRLANYISWYPPKPPQSKYKRTGTLGRRWTTKVTESDGGVEGKIGNNTEYAPLVQSAKFQTKVHQRTGWRTDEKAVKTQRPAIVKDFNQAIERALK